jgi:Glycosyl transferase family 2
VNSLGTGPLPATEQEQAQFFARLQEGFFSASARTGEIVRDFRLAGTRVRLRFAGEALVPVIVPGLANTTAAWETGLACEILLWDSESTGIQLPPPPRSWRDFTRRGNIWGFDSRRYRSAYHWGEGSVNAMDCETHQAVFWVSTHQHVPLWVLASPLRSILHWWMELNGRQLAHAASVGYDGRGVLIPGRAGSGKSSTSLACLLAGMDFVSDDYLAVGFDPDPRTYRLYSTAKLDPRTLSRYPELAARCRTVHQPGFDKVVLFLEDGYGAQLKDSLRLELALRPWISGDSETVLGKAEPLEIESALASETLGHLPHVGAGTVEFLNRVSTKVPRAAIHLGTERFRIPNVIRQALASRIDGDLPRSGSEKLQPYISVITHFHQEDREELRTLAADVEAQGYPRTEFIVVASGPACAMQEEVSKLAGTVRFFTYPEAVVNAEAWNRGIREAFAELLVLIEPGDRFPPGALETLAGASEIDSRAAWVRGKPFGEHDSFGPLRGALMRKSAFQECGLFSTEPFFQGREQRSWLDRVEAKGLAGRSIEAITLRAAETGANKTDRLLLRPDFNFLRAELVRRQGKKVE